MLIFIVPYRDREQHLKFFDKHMKKEILEDMKEGEEYEIMYIHQEDKRPFNRGALKNIGFKIVKEKYPDEYKRITLVFNDVDTMPFTKDFLKYETEKGKIKHFYGVRTTLGGIVSIKGEDFEKINGYPNIWSWGLEDLGLQKRAERMGIQIDRNNYYAMLDKNILHFMHSLERDISNTEVGKYKEDMHTGINGIKNIKYEEEGSMKNIKNYTTEREPPKRMEIHDVRKKSIGHRIGLNFN